MCGDRTDRVVDPDLFDEQRADDDDDAGDEADQDRGPRCHEGARGRDRDEGCNGTVQHHRKVGLLDDEPRRHHGTEHSGGCGEVRVQRHVGEEADAAKVDR